MTTENTTEKKIIHAIIKNDRGDEFIDEGYETFEDAVDAMMNDWEKLHVQERVTIAKRDYCDENGADYLIAVGYYEETGESELCTTLAEEIARRDEIEDQELEEDF